MCVCVYYFRKVWRKSDKSTRKLSGSKRPTERGNVERYVHVCDTLSHYTECQYSDRIETAMEVT